MSIAEVMNPLSEKAVCGLFLIQGKNCQIAYCTWVVQRRNSGTKRHGMCKVLESNETTLSVLSCARTGPETNSKAAVRSLDETRTFVTDYQTRLRTAEKFGDLGQLQLGQ